MTAKKFIEHPIAGKVYLTGDIVRFLHDGSIEFVGRTDDLVKLGGIRVELSEISTALEGCHPRSAEVFTMQLSRSDRPQKALVSFVAAPSLQGEKVVCTDFEAVDIVSSAMPSFSREAQSASLRWEGTRTRAVIIVNQI